MRKLLLLFAVMLSTVGAWAQISALAELDNSKAYLLKNANDMGYAIWKDGNNLTLCGATSTYTDALDESAAGSNWQIVNYNEQYYLYNVGAQKFAVTQGGPTYLTETPTPISIENASNGFAFNSDGDAKHYMCAAHHLNPPVQFWTLSDNGSAWQIIESTYTGEDVNALTIVENYYNSLIDVTYNYYVGDELRHTEVVVDQIIGSVINAPTFGFVTFTNPVGTISRENNVFNINCTLDDAPLTFSTIDAPIWQTIEMHRYGSFRIWDYVSNDNPVNVTEMGADKMGVVDDTKLWCFVGDHFGFRIYNKKAGLGVTLNATSGNPKVGIASSGNDEWFFAKSSVSQDANASCFTSRSTTYMNQQGGRIAYHSSPDNGSTCYITAPSATFQPAAEEYKTLLENYEYPVDAPENALGIIEPTDEQLNSFISGVESETTDIAVMQALYKLANDIKATAKPLTSGYYFIKNTGEGSDNNRNWYATYGSNGTDFMAIAEDLSAKHVWSFETIADEDGFKLKSCNLGKYASLIDAGATSQITSDYENGFKFTFASDGLGKFTIRDGDGNRMRTEPGSGAINRWEKDRENDETWYIIPATELGITIGDAGYATTHLPFDVTLPKSLKAYAVTAAEAESATLTEMTDIPANEGAILKGDKGTYTLTIAAASSDWKDNMLEGTNIDEEVDGPGYVLSMPAGKNVGLYAAVLTDGKFKNNANKAYLPKPEGTPDAARFFVFDFGTETAIEGIESESTANAVVYDLAGRRVQNAQKGVFIVNGKVVIK